MTTTNLLMSSSKKAVYSYSLPPRVTPTLCLLRRRLRLSREVSDDVERARGHVVRLRSQFGPRGNYTDNALVEELFFDNKQHGLGRGWHSSSGALWWEYPYIDDEWHGRVREWYADGITLQHEATYINDKQHGFERWWNVEGTLYWEIPYVDGKWHGTERLWRFDGTLSLEIVFNNGVEVSRTRHLTNNDYVI